jgi:hypothetical protein
VTPAELIRDVEEYASEWTEHAECPATLVAGILACEILNLKDYIEYLEKRLIIYERGF